MRRNAPTPVLLTVLLLAALLGLPVFSNAQTVSFTWTGGGTAGVVSDVGNWQSAGIPLGDGSQIEDVTFGVATGSAQSVVVPSSGLTLHDLTFNGGSTRPAYTFSGTSTPTFVITGNVSADDGGSIVFNNSLNVTLASDGTDNGHTINVTSSSLTVTVDSNISENTSAYITKDGIGALTLSGANTYTGGTTLYAGTLNINSTTAIGTGSLNIQNVGVTLDNTSGSPLTLSNNNAQYWNGNFTFTGTNDLNLGTGAVTLQGSRQVTVSAGTLTVGGVISDGEGAGSLTKAGTGTLVLNGASTYSGGTSLNGGTLQIGSSSIMDGSIISGPVGTGVLKLANGTTLTLPEEYDYTLHNNIALDSTSGTVNISVPIYSGLILRGDISGAADLNKTGIGSLDLYGNNTFTGDFYAGGSTVNLWSDTAAGQGELELGNSSTVNFQTSAPVIHGLSADSSSDNVYLLSGSTLTINQDSNTTFGGHLDGHGGASIIKNGTGSLVFAYTNDYDGGTTINAGTLVASNNTALGSGAVTLNGGTLSVSSGITLGNSLVFTGSTASVLAGNGTFGSAVDTGGFPVVISPGSSIGNLTFGAGLTLASSSAISFQVQDAAGAAGTGYDLVTVSGGLLNLTASANTITFNVVFLNSDGNDGTPSNFNPAGSYSWKFATATNTITGFNANQFHLVTGGASAGLPGTFSFTADSNNLYLNFTPVPEPSTWALLGLGLGFVFLAWRRRRG